MSRVAVSVLALVVWIGFAPAARAADDDPKDLIAKAIKANGGEEYLDKHKAGQMKLKGKIDIPGVGVVDATQEVSFMIPDKFREAVAMKIAGQDINTLTLINGDKVTIEVNGKEIETPQQVKDAVKDVGPVMNVSRLTPLVKEKGYELSLVGDDKVEGKKVVGIRVSKKGQKDVTLFLDRETWLIAKVEYRGADPTTGNEINVERIVTEYQMKDGKPIPKKIVVKHEGKTFVEAEILELKLYEKLDDSEFKK